MKATRVLIRPISLQFTNTRFTAAYSIDGRIRCWCEDDTIKEFSSNDVLPKLKNIEFKVTKRSYEISYKEPETPEEIKMFFRQTETNKLKDLYQRFLCNHPLCYVNGQAHPGTKNNPLFDVVDIGLDLILKKEDFLSKLTAVNMVSNMSEKEREDVMYYYGNSPIGKDPNELLLTLANLKDGLCLNDSKMFIKKWKNVTSDMKKTVNIRKAISMKVIEERTVDGNMSYYVGNTWVGIDFAGIFDFMNKNPKIYNEHVLPNIGEEVFVESHITKTEEPKEVIVVDQTDNFTKEQTKELREEAKKLATEGYIEPTVKYWIMSAKNILPYIDNARRLKEKDAKLQTV